MVQHRHLAHSRREALGTVKSVRPTDHRQTKIDTNPQKGDLDSQPRMPLE
jgi:hypothetical protein